MMSLTVPTLAAAAPVPESCDVTALPGGGAHPTGSRGATASGINDAGLIVGWRAGDDGIEDAVIWDKQGDATELAQLPGGSQGNRAHDINNAGRSVGVVYETHDHPHPWKGEMGFAHAVTWDRNGNLTELPYLPGIEELGAQAQAVAINDRGVITGWASGAPTMKWGEVFSGPHYAVIWTPTPGGGYTITELAGPPNSFEVEAADINNQGQVVGWALLRGGDGAVAVVWDREGNPTVLPAPDGARNVSATGINNKGVIVGRGTVGGTTVPLVWTPAPGGGYTVSVLAGAGSAWDINDAGIISGVVGTDAQSPNHPDNRQNTAAVWTPTARGGYELTELCHLPGQTPAHHYSTGMAINNQGQVAGISAGGAQNQDWRAVTWDTR